LIRINGDAQERGYYVCDDPDCIARLLKNKRLGNSLKEALTELEGKR